MKRLVRVCQERITREDYMEKRFARGITFEEIRELERLVYKQLISDVESNGWKENAGIALYTHPTYPGVVDLNAEVGAWNKDEDSGFMEPYFTFSFIEELNEFLSDKARIDRIYEV